MLGLATPVLLIFNVVACVYWLLTKRKYWAVLPLVALGFNTHYLKSVFQWNSQHRIPEEQHADNPEPDGYLKVVTYNVQHFGTEITGYSAKNLAEYLEEQGVDILCFQEFDGNRYFSLDSLRHVFAHWKYGTLATHEATQSILPIVVFSRYPIADSRIIRYDNSANSSLLCDVLLKTDTIRIINNHLQTTSVSQNRGRLERGLADQNDRKKAKAMRSFVDALHQNDIKRANQTDSICRLIEESPYPVIACGDFNSLPSSYTYHKMNNLLQDGFRSSGRGYMYTFRYYKRLLRIDYIFHSPSLEGLYYYSPSLTLNSDHNPVLMELRYR
jgi:endonuclease/exonuclease/phosphatase family metal-dependent hydrolase